MIKEGKGSTSNPYKLLEDKITKEWTFDYTGGEQEFKVPYDGEYKLEVWGSEGGKINNSAIGGYGAYATGTVSLSKTDKIYINVGGKGQDSPNVLSGNISKGGYNGGGSAGDDGATTWAGGGGASHIALEKGLLSTLETKKDNILIVASAGGGAGWYISYLNSGGSGGGIQGNNGNGYLPGVGGNQEKGGFCVIMNDFVYGHWQKIESLIKEGSFGQGSSEFLYSNKPCGGGGGAGLYGGGSGYTYGSSGAGGSSFIGNPVLTNKVMYCYNCEESSEENTKTISTTNVSEEAISNYAKMGNGYAKITLISEK